jgi:hypothetical protein
MMIDLRLADLNVKLLLIYHVVSRQAFCVEKNLILLVKGLNGH